MLGAAQLPLFASAARADCTSVLPDPFAPAGPVRTITPRNLIELRDIGYPDASLTGPSPLAVSPDGTQVAFVLSRADVADNGYCRALVVVPLASGGHARLIDSGGEFIPLGTFVRGLWIEVGLPRLVTPVWSADGTSIALLKRENSKTGAVIVPLDGKAPIAVRAESDIEDVWWAADGKRLLFTSRAGLPAVQQAIDREGDSGWHYDARIAPNYGPRPRVGESDAPLQTFAFELASGAIAPAAGTPPDSENQALSGSGRRAWAQSDSRSLLAEPRLWATGHSGQAVRCGAGSCVGPFSGLSWSPDGKDVRFLRREGWDHELTVLYRWRVGNSRPVRIAASKDVIQNCVAAGPQLVCTSETSTSPRRIVLLDPRSGRRRTLFDPNPEFVHLRLGTVRRLRWRNDRGLEAWGDLVLPPTYAKGEKLPLIVVQYHSRGFLRGGTGDEYPIYPLAARGFAVLSFERPPAVADSIPNLTTVAAINAANEAGWADRRSLLSAILKGVDAAIATGTVDPKRIGITGLSDGATSARFALINSDRFAAAAISSCCLEPKTVMSYGGIAWAEYNRAVGYPPATVEDTSFWRPMSLALNVGRIHVPLLMQLSDDEYLLSLEAFEALREYSEPVDMYVFPGEHHIKWQPRHRLAIYARNIDWFAFWLKCEEDPAPEKVAQYRRWESMRTSAPAAARLCPKSIRLSSSTEPTPRHR